ncbi:MAG: 2-amino-4-hydroxy-6-hydroxymethyldihydropteridine diphosphokinase [Desulfotomaculales bacterium]
MTTAYVGLGSNLGDRRFFVREALRLISEVPGIKVKRVAPLYRTAPVGLTEQEWFFNTVAEIETPLSPHALLAALLAVEARLGRVRTRRWGPRTIDLDLLLYGDLHLHTPDLTVPHPRLTERAFAVVPLADLAPEMILPGGAKARDLAAALAAGQEIFRVEEDATDA